MRAARCLLLGLLLGAAVLAAADAKAAAKAAVPPTEGGTGVVAGVRRMLRDYWGGGGYGRHYFHNGYSAHGGAWNSMGWEGPANGFASGNYWFTRMYRAPRIPNEYRMETSNDRRWARVTRKA